MKSITCCKECVPPRRYPGCKGQCEEYIVQKEALDEEQKKIKQSRREHLEIQGYEIEKTRKWLHNESRKPKLKRR